MTKQNGTAPDVFGRVFQLKALDDIRQRDAVAWNRAYNAHEGLDASSAERQAALQAAIAAGWILSPDCRYEDVIDGATGKQERRYYFDGVPVDDMRPAEVTHYGRLCGNLYIEATLPPKPTS